MHWLAGGRGAFGCDNTGWMGMDGFWAREIDMPASRLLSSVFLIEISIR